MSRRGHLTEQQLAFDDEYRDAVDRIAARLPSQTTTVDQLVAAIRDGVSSEMRRLVEIPLEVKP